VCKLMFSILEICIEQARTIMANDLTISTKTRCLSMCRQKGQEELNVGCIELEYTDRNLRKLCTIELESTHDKNVSLFIDKQP